jgi:hypothetical protein
MKVNISYHKSKKNIASLTEDMSGSQYNWISTTIDFNDLHELTCDSLVQYSPYRFMGGERAKHNVIRNGFQDLLIFDIDDGKSMSKCMETLIDYRFLISTTKSHQKVKKNKVCDRFRILIPVMNSPVDDNIYEECISILGASLGADKQANMLGSCFLGFNGSQYAYNDGKTYDLTKVVSIATDTIVRKERARELKRSLSKLNCNSSKRIVDTSELKSTMSYDDSIQILSDIGVEVKRRKISIRENDRSPSVHMYDNGRFVDFGSGISYDIFDIVQHFTGMSFKESLSYVNDFLQGENN